MSTRNYILLENASTESSTDQYSDKAKAAGYHSVAGGLHTIVFSFDNFQGSLKMQGTLVEEPSDTDWVDITFDDDTTVVVDNDSTTQLSTISRNFTGNFVWIRAKYTLINGTITKIQYNF
jgi:hypothetical protein